LTVRISGTALAKVIRHTISSPRREVAGLLIGRERGEELLVTDAVTGHQTGSLGHVALDELVMARLTELLHSSGAGLYIVGWYHSHPGIGVFMSAIDYATQLNYQRLYPKSVALVIDPVEIIKSKVLTPGSMKFFRVEENGAVVELKAVIDGPVRVPKVVQIPTSSGELLQEEWGPFAEGIDGDQASSPEKLTRFLPTRLSSVINQLIARLVWWRAR
jgi:26S proteasome regulatory subunit N11